MSEQVHLICYRIRILSKLVSVVIIMLTGAIERSSFKPMVYSYAYAEKYLITEE